MGLGGDTPAATNCNSGNSLLATARAVRAQNTQAATETYKQAADAYRRAGDIALANAVLAEAQALTASATPISRSASRYTDQTI
jgi:type II secretory pathway pseudopilin PulG